MPVFVNMGVIIHPDEKKPRRAGKPSGSMFTTQRRNMTNTISDDDLAALQQAATALISERAPLPTYTDLPPHVASIAPGLVRPDYLTMTYDLEPQEATWSMLGILAGLFGLHRGAISSTVVDRGALGWIKTTKYVDDFGHLLVTLLTGGDSQRGRARLEIRGDACSRAADWSLLLARLSECRPTITRIDLAADFLDGSVTLSEVVDAHGLGLFSSRGPAPATSCAGDWLGDNPKGRTLYIGSRASGKLWRWYEKGKQQGDPSSPWVRGELEIRNSERDIPLDVLTNCATYYGGGSKYAAAVMGTLKVSTIALRKHHAALILDHQIHHARQSYGHLIELARSARIDETVIAAGLSRVVERRNTPLWSQLLQRVPDWQEVLFQSLAFEAVSAPDHGTFSRRLSQVREDFE